MIFIKGEIVMHKDTGQLMRVFNDMHPCDEIVLCITTEFTTSYQRVCCDDLMLPDLRGFAKVGYSDAPTYQVAINHRGNGQGLYWAGQGLKKPNMLSKLYHSSSSSNSKDFYPIPPDGAQVLWKSFSNHASTIWYFWDKWDVPKRQLTLCY